MATFANKSRSQKNTYFLEEKFCLKRTKNLRKLSPDDSKRADLPLKLLNCEWNLFYTSTYFATYKYVDENGLMILKMTTQSANVPQTTNGTHQVKQDRVIPLLHFGVFDFQPNCALPTKRSIETVIEEEFIDKIYFCIYKLPRQSIPLFCWDYTLASASNLCSIVKQISNDLTAASFADIFLVPTNGRTRVVALQKIGFMFLLDEGSQALSIVFLLAKDKRCLPDDQFECQAMVNNTTTVNQLEAGSPTCWNGLTGHPQSLLSPKMWRLKGGADGNVMCLSKDMVVKYTTDAESQMVKRLMLCQSALEPHILKYYAVWNGLWAYGASKFHATIGCPDRSRRRNCLLMENIGDSLNTFDIEDVRNITSDTMDLSCRMGLALQYCYIHHAIIKNTGWMITDAWHNYAIIREPYAQRRVEIRGVDIVIPASQFVIKIFDFGHAEETAENQGSDLEIWEGMTHFLRDTDYDKSLHEIDKLSEKYSMYQDCFTRLVDDAKNISKQICTVDDIENQLKRGFAWSDSDSDSEEETDTKRMRTASTS